MVYDFLGFQTQTCHFWFTLTGPKSDSEKVHSVPIVTVVTVNPQHNAPRGSDYWAKSILGRVWPALTTASI